MLNIDDRLIKETLPAIKPNGLAVLLVISIHLNKESGTCFPSHERLMKMTGLGSESVYNALKALKKEGLLISSQSIDSKHKTFSRRTFKVNTDYIGIFVSAKNAPELESEPLTDLPDAAMPHAVEPDAANHETYLLNESEQLNELEQLNNNNAAEFLIKSTTEIPGVTMVEKVKVEAEKEKTPPNSAPPPKKENAWQAFDIDTAAASLKEDYTAAERFARDLSCSLQIAKEKLGPAIDEFVFDQKTVCNAYPNDREFRKHFFNWLPAKVKAKLAAKAVNHPTHQNSPVPTNIRRL